MPIVWIQSPVWHGTVNISVVDNLWLLTASFLVLMMQIGFLLLEGGRVRSKNSINVAQKNVSDLMVAWVGFFLFGFWIMYGITMPVSGNSNPSPLHFLFQLGFCATAASIVSGGVAERMRFIPYLVLAMIIGGLLYPIVGRLAWGNTFIDVPFALLENIGFVDFAGGTVVHTVGGWAALVAILMIGPRTDRFDENGNPKTLASHSSILSLQGALILTFGWIGFNAGTLSVSDPLFSEVIVNTFSAAAFGAAAGSLIGALLDKGVFNPARVINGLLGGLVTSTAAVHVMEAYECMFFGFIGGGLATYASQFLLEKFKFDDPVDVFATHGIAGIFGTLIYAFVAPTSALVGGSRLTQFGIQLLGVAVVCAIVTVTIFVALKITSRFTSLRVTTEEELIGLNYSEHGELVGTDRLRRALNEQIDNIAPFAQPITVDDNDEHSELAQTVNKLISRQEEATQAIKASELKFKQFANTASDWLWETNAQLKLTAVSFTGDKNISASIKNWLGAPLQDVLSLSSSETEILTKAVLNGVSFGPIEATLELSNGESRCVELRGTPNLSDDNKLIGYRGTFTDITIRKSAENKAIYLSMHDELTGLANRRALQTDLISVISNAKQASNRVAVVIIDLDGFKAVNDSFGHAAGDDILIAATKRIEEVLDDNQRLYRTGGDEFVLIIENLRSQTLQDVVSESTGSILENLNSPFALNDNNVSIGASLGVALFPDHAVSVSDLMRRADLAMYSAKYNGKSRVVWFDPELDNEMDDRYKLEQEIKRAIEQKEFYLVYQPLVDTQSQQLISFEALIRWRHPTRGELSPFEFIGILEKHQMMDRLGEFVLDKACEFASSWSVDSNTGLPRLAVNISPSQLNSLAFVDTVVTALTKHKMPANRLELEITEDALIENHGIAIEIISRLQKLGVQTSIDDFGTGQTSLRYLSSLPVSTMKIDRSFVSSIGDNERAAEITRSMIAMGKKLGFTVVAEGVEDQQQLDMLKDWNCPIAQGYLFSKPIQSDEVLSMIDTFDDDSEQPQQLPKAS